MGNHPIKRNHAAVCQRAVFPVGSRAGLPGQGGYTSVVQRIAQAEGMRAEGCNIGKGPLIADDACRGSNGPIHMNLVGGHFEPGQFRPRYRDFAETQRPGIGRIRWRQRL